MESDVFSSVRYLDLKDLSNSDLEHLKDLFKIKIKQIDEEIRKRKQPQRS